MIIPLDQLSPEALDALVDEYCLREHGCNDTEDPLGSRKAGILQQIKRGTVVVLYTPNNPNQVATLVARDMLDANELEE